MSAQTPNEPTPPPKPRKELPLVSIPDNPDELADELAELFEEDKVTHQHGDTEPEGE